jgi:hypothetical protein
MNRIFVLLVVVIATSGCRKIQEKLAEKAAEKAIETATGNEVDLDTKGGGVTVKDGKGGVYQAGPEAKLPEGWSVPIYPGAKISASASSPQAKMVHLQTQASPEEVVTFYRGKMTGYAKETEMDLGASKTIVFKKGKEQVGVTAAKQDDDEKGSIVQISVSGT